MITMLLGGLWHGASWRFVAWGGLHGLYLVGERILRDRFAEAKWVSRPSVRLGLALSTYGLVCLTWVFFRATDFGSAWSMLEAMLLVGDGSLALGVRRVAEVGAITLALLAAHWWLRDTTFEDRWTGLAGPVRIVTLVFMLAALALAHGDQRAFIYFQF